VLPTQSFANIAAHQVNVLLSAQTLDELLVVCLIAVVREDAELCCLLLQGPARVVMSDAQCYISAKGLDALNFQLTTSTTTCMLQIAHCNRTCTLRANPAPNHRAPVRSS
jgi:hypothetical protein